MRPERDILIRVVGANARGPTSRTGLESSRRQLLQWLFVPILTAIVVPTSGPKQRSSEPDRIYVVNGWVLTGEDLEELGIDAF